MWPSKKRNYSATSPLGASPAYDLEMKPEPLERESPYTRPLHEKPQALAIFPVPQNSYFKTLKISTQPQVAWLIVLTQQLTDVHLKNKNKKIIINGS